MNRGSGFSFFVSCLLGSKGFFIFCVLGLSLAVTTGCSDSDPSEESRQNVSQTLAFSSVSKEIGLGDFKHDNGSFGGVFMPEIVGAGVGVIDYNNDDWPDLLLVGGGRFEGHVNKETEAIRLYRNTGGGFEEVSEQAGLLGLRTHSYGVTVADYDNDGDEDFYLTSLEENILYRNDDGRFVDVSTASGLGQYKEWSTSAIFFDADNDSWPDLFVANYVDWSEESDLNCQYEGVKAYCTPEAYDGIASRLYMNQGDGSFVETSISSGIFDGLDSKIDKSLGVAEMDFNNDLLPDLLVANDTERDFLFLNKGNGKFEETGISRGVAYSEHGKTRAGMGIDTGVTDSTGLVSVYIGNFSDETVGVYRHGGNGLFRDRAALSRVSLPSYKTLTFGLFLADVDIDGDLDLFMANGHVQTYINKVDQRVTFLQQPQLYINRGNGTFDEWKDEDDFDIRILGRGAAHVDYDRDGDPDLIITENNGPLHFWRNDHAGNNFIKINLEGVQSNKDGLGSEIRIYSNGSIQERRIHAGSSFLSSMEKTALFGLGQSEQIDSVIVKWPSGVVDRLESLSPNQEIRIKEGSGSYQELTK